MIITRKAYICDWCGRTDYFDEENDMRESFDHNWIHLPDPIGHICPACYGEVMSLYERIHAPVKAMQESKESQKLHAL